MTTINLKYYCMLLTLVLTFVMSCSHDSRQSGGSIDETETIFSGTVANQSIHDQSGVLIRVYSIDPISKPLQNRFFSSKEFQAYSDSNGRFAFPSLPVGLYILHASKGNRFGLLDTVEISSSTAAYQEQLSPMGALLITEEFRRTSHGADSFFIPQLLQFFPSSVQQGDTLFLPTGEYQLIPISNSTVDSSGKPRIANVLSESVTKLLDTINSTSTLSPRIFNYSLKPGPDEGKDVLIVFGHSGGYNIISKLSSINHGATTCTAVSSYDNNTILRSLYYFAVPLDISPDNIDSAKMTLHIDSWVNKISNDSLTIYTHKMLRDWSEGKGTSANCSSGGTDQNSSIINGATGEEASFGVPWNSIGVGLDNVDATSLPNSSTRIASLEPDSIRIELTALVKDWIKSPSENYGVLLRSDSEFSETFPHIPEFITSDAKDRPESWPGLTIYFHD